VETPRWLKATAVALVALLALIAGMLPVALYKSAPGQTPVLTAASISRPVTVTLTSAQHITTTGQSSTVGVSYYRDGLLYISTTRAADTISYTLETSPDNVNWYTYCALAPVASTSVLTLPIALFGPFLHLAWAASGTTDVTSTAVLALKE
jgi:hypothetical protein